MDERWDEIEKEQMLKYTPVGTLIVHHHDLGLTFERHTEERTLQLLFGIHLDWIHDRTLVFYENNIYLHTNDIRFIVEELSKLL